VRTSRIVAIGAVAALGGGGLFANEKLNDFRVVLPEYQRPANAVKLNQNWTDDQRHRFHHTAQGTRLVPANWFVALEQPCFSPLGCDLFSDPAYLGRFGFIPSHADPQLNPHGLPIGFAEDKDFVDPVDGSAYPVVGLTCAACHTGELFYGDNAVLIEGAPAMIEVAAFQKALGLAMAFTTTWPMSMGRYGRFEERVLGPDATDAQKAELKTRFDTFLAAARHQADVTGERKIYDNPAGFARTDALTRIGNQVFAADTGIDDNYAVSNAAVRFPQIWNASWFDWVQYNSSIADPLARNIGEALGVRAALKLSGDDAGEFRNSVNMRGLRDLEMLLAGPAVFEGLASPKWPDAFPPLDQAKAAAGATLYADRCQGCHLPSLPKLLEELKPLASDSSYTPEHWWKSARGNWYVKTVGIPIEEIGTDPRQAVDFKKREADTGALKMGRVSAAKGLDVVTEGIANAFFSREKVGPEAQWEWRSGRDATDPRVRDELIYKARPLNGIWAVAPYLHNGSVPTLEALLSPDDSARPKTFYLGSKVFDPVKVGFDGRQMPGATHFDTSLPGNANTGHWFRNGPTGKGVIGPALSAEERAQIIEYLKSL
jgi:mono/diheme cytochrome c family protein